MIISKEVDSKVLVVSKVESRKSNAEKFQVSGFRFQVNFADNKELKVESQKSKVKSRKSKVERRKV